MRRLQRFGIYFTFGLGLVNLTATLARFFVNLANKFGGSLTQVELMVAIDINFCLIIACLPSLRPYLRLLQGRSLSSYPTPNGPSNIHSEQRTDKGNFRRLRNPRNGGETDNNFQVTGQEGNAPTLRRGKPDANAESHSTGREDARTKVALLPVEGWHSNDGTEGQMSTGASLIMKGVRRNRLVASSLDCSFTQTRNVTTVPSNLMAETNQSGT
ncbi:hypothetical protein B0J13DRAFT_534666 [Dactylonectria estremocensis]|uniref:Integral membrane protein n=1 Tax=Dactylonectria estremocensis TaxID=1079267 RepID=A0A9P9CYI3_9HYPO|nr:hypothetical protein B0J13DRAFT_534666 [Dactylonectria estremocensis]